MANAITRIKADIDFLPRGKTNIVYLDDDPMDHKLMSLYVQRSEDADRYTLTCLSCINETRIALSEGNVDILVLDNRMPTSENFKLTLQKLSPIDARVKIIVTSSDVEDAFFTKVDDLERKPDAVVEKTDLRKAINNGLFQI